MMRILFVFFFISGDFGYDLDSVSKFIANATFYFLAKQLIELIICNKNVLFNGKAHCFGRTTVEEVICS